MADAENDDIVALYVEYYAIIANAEAVTAKFGVRQRLGILERIVFEAKKGFADAFFNVGIKPVNVLDGFLGIYKTVSQCPNTSSCVLILPAL